MANDKGIDSPLDCTGKAGAIKAAGLQFVGRYYRSHGSKWPALSASEAAAISKQGLNVVALFESASNHASYFSYSAGVNDATTAYHQAMIAGQPARTPIYFAVDFDASQQEVAGAVHDYFAGIAAGYSTIGHGNPAYDIGVYGSGLTCSWLLAHRSALRSWLAVSAKWRGTKTFTNWNIRQGKPNGALTFDNDSDETNPEYGGFRTVSLVAGKSRIAAA